MMRRWLVAIILITVCSHQAMAAYDAAQLYEKLRSKVLSVKDYTADIKMKVSVAYMKVPLLKGTLYFKAPDKMRMERNGGISILPKKNLNLTLSNLIPTGKVTVIDAGSADINGIKARILKVIPEDDRNNIILTRMWVDETRMLVLRTETTTQNDGTVTMTLEYGKYVSYALPDKVIIYMDLKDYKVPKGITMDYNDAPTSAPAKTSGKSQKGTIEITYLKYLINTNIPDAIFLKKD